MSKQSFHEILQEKINAAAAAEPVCSEAPPVSPRDMWDATISPIFHVQVNSAARVARTAYPRRPPSRQSPLSIENVPAPRVVSAPAPPPIRWIYKKQLDETEQQKWHLFEKIFGQTFGEQIHRAQAMGAFRSFIKKVHPDTAEQKTDYNFATLVKIKNEFIAVLEKHGRDTTAQT